MAKYRYTKRRVKKTRRARKRYTRYIRRRGGDGRDSNIECLNFKNYEELFNYFNQQDGDINQRINNIYNCIDTTIIESFLKNIVIKFSLYIQNDFYNFLLGLRPTYIEDNIISKPNTNTNFLERTSNSFRNSLRNSFSNIFYQKSLDIMKKLIIILTVESGKILTKNNEALPLGKLTLKEIKYVSEICIIILFFLKTKHTFNNNKSDLDNFFDIIFKKIFERINQQKTDVVFTGTLDIPMEHMLSKKQILTFFKNIIQFFDENSIFFPRINNKYGNFCILINYTVKANYGETWDNMDDTEWENMINSAKNINLLFEDKSSIKDSSTSIYNLFQDIKMNFGKKIPRTPVTATPAAAQIAPTPVTATPAAAHRNFGKNILPTPVTATPAAAQTT